MKLRNLLLADAVDAGAEGKVFIHGGGIGRITGGSFPWTQPRLALFVTVEREEGEEPGSDHLLEMDIVDADGSTIAPTMNSLFRVPADEVEGVPVDMNALVTMNGLTFPAPGVYTLIVRVDGLELGRAAFRVVAGDDPGATHPMGERD